MLLQPAQLPGFTGDVPEKVPAPLRPQVIVVRAAARGGTEEAVSGAALAGDGHGFAS